MSEAKHTPGPWFCDERGSVWRRPISDLYENGGGVAGDKPLAIVQKGWYGEEEKSFPLHDNARLIAAAPELLDACEEAYESVNGREHQLPGYVMNKLRAAITKAKATQP